MKKETVETRFLEKQEQQAKRIQNEEMRKARLQAITQCRTWLLASWAAMLAPVEEKLKALDSEASPLLEKETQKLALTEQEQQRLQIIHEIYPLYYAFYKKIHPTAHRALVAKQERAREKASRR